MRPAIGKSDVLCGKRWHGMRYLRRPQLIRKCTALFSADEGRRLERLHIARISEMRKAVARRSSQLPLLPHYGNADHRRS